MKGIQEIPKRFVTTPRLLPRFLFVPPLLSRPLRVCSNRFEAAMGSGSLLGFADRRNGWLLDSNVTFRLDGAEGSRGKIHHVSRKIPRNE